MRAAAARRAITTPTARAVLALAAGESGRSYFEALLHAVGQPNEAEMTALSVLVGRHHTLAREQASNVVPLEACWRALWRDVQTRVRPEVWERLAAVR